MPFPEEQDLYRGCHSAASAGQTL